MRRLIVFLIFFIASICLGLKIAQDPGFAMFSYGAWSVEMPLWFAVIALMTLLLLGSFILKFLYGVDFSFYRFKNWMNWRRYNKSFNKTNHGLMQLIERQWKSAEANLLVGMQKNESPLVNFLGLAESAHEQGQYEKRDAYIQKAHHIAPEAEVAIGLTQAKMQVQSGALESALATLRHLHALAPKHPAVIKQLQEIYLLLNDWNELLQLLPQIRQYKILSPENYAQLERQTHLALLGSVNMNNQFALADAWESLPKKYKVDPGFVALFAKSCLPFKDEAQNLEVTLRKAIQQAWLPELVRLYAQLQSPNPAKQLANAESWLEEYPNQSVLYMALGKLAMRAQLWGKARTYFETGFRLGGDSQGYLEYGKLMQQLGESEHAALSYEKGLMLSLDKPFKG